MGDHPAYVTIRSRRPADGNSLSSADSTYGSSSGDQPRTATHDISRVSYHLKHLNSFVKTLEDSANRAFPNRGLSSQRYKKVQALLLHWGSDDLFVLPELEDLERCLREDYAFNTEIFPIPSDNSHLELMMQVGKLIKDHEAQDTLFLVYYGGHARIDESRQSTWCATRHPDSPWLQWSAIQTLLERSASDVLILLDCCAGAASATFPNGNSVTETISASSWDAIAPDPGRYSFTNALIEVLQEWRLRTFSAAMLHAEVLARLKHPRPITINGKLFEARSTPVHFMMTSNHRAPSIELSRVVPAEKRPPSPPQDIIIAADGNEAPESASSGRGPGAPISGEPNEDTPHVMISLALEDNQQLDLNAWEQWLSNFPALAKYVKVQGVFKSHSTLLLLSMPVMVWDMLPEDHATSFVAFIRSNNMLAQKPSAEDKGKTEVSVGRVSQAEPRGILPYSASTNTFFSDMTYTYAPSETGSLIGQQLAGLRTYSLGDRPGSATNISAEQIATHDTVSPSSSPSMGTTRSRGAAYSTTSLNTTQRQLPLSPRTSEGLISRTMISNHQRSTRRTIFQDIPEPPKFSQHVETLLQQYYQQEPLPNDDQKNFIASNLGIEPWHVEAWFHHRRERDVVSMQFETLKMDDLAPNKDQGARMILPHHLNRIIEILPPGRLLLIDLRPPTDFERSHIRGAINLRAPLRFVQEASLDMIERAFTDDESRQKFGEWQSTICMVLYARAVDYSLECPMAEALYAKFKSWGWSGRCFVLKGHYREFSVSYSMSIVGSKMTDEARASVEAARRDSDSATSSEDDRARRAQYEDLLARIDDDGRVSPSTPNPAAGSDRVRAMSQHEQDLEAEFLRRAPDLYRKALDAQNGAIEPDSAAAGAGAATATAIRTICDGSTDPGDGGNIADTTFESDTKAPLVEYLDRGLSHIRQGRPADAANATVASTTTAPTGAPPGLSKLAAERYHQHQYLNSVAVDTATATHASDDAYVKITRGDVQQASDPATTAIHPKGKDGMKEVVSGDETPKRGRGGFLNKVLRRA
ncbi:hypothetical protein CCHL11_00515 [Colletotrichum chlorophyti]|uniref:Tyrosine-protein phosphatase non-receptor type 6 n=1 Tax=Colletotrichum chlorophyti TaxID=708187 RepID=A0A1Q8RV21_9PEZI|nr:hypothetical protein CCHL11_00515 [Colletotrichum chlorophyti]